MPCEQTEALLERAGFGYTKLVFSFSFQCLGRLARDFGFRLGDDASEQSAYLQKKKVAEEESFAQLMLEALLLIQFWVFTCLPYRSKGHSNAAHLQAIPSVALA